MTQDVLYTTDWNSLTRRPVLGHQWVDASTARDLYTTRAGLDVVDGLELDDGGVPRPRWVIGIGTSGRIRVQFFDEHTTIVHMVDWDWIEGRLWRWITYDWEYPNTTQHWEQDESIVKVKAEVRSDGDGLIKVIDKQAGGRLTTEFSGRATDAYWLDVPEFGNWAALADPGPSTYEVAGREAPARAS